MVSAKKKEARRQFFHILFGVGLVSLILNNIIGAREIFFLGLLSWVLSLLSLEFKVPVVEFFLRNMERSEDIKVFPGKGFIFFLSGIFLALKLFDKNIALAAIIIMVLGDSVSNLTGRVIRKSFYKIQGKNIEGLLIGFLAGGIGASFFVSPFFGFTAAFFGMMIEGYGIKIGERKIDDNFFIPLVSGSVLYLLETGFKVFL